MSILLDTVNIARGIMTSKKEDDQYPHDASCFCYDCCVDQELGGLGRRIKRIEEQVSRLKLCFVSLADVLKRQRRSGTKG